LYDASIQISLVTSYSVSNKFEQATSELEEFNSLFEQFESNFEGCGQ